MSQPIDFANYQELMMANAQMKKNNPPQVYQVAPLTNMVPGIFPIPIISMRPNAEFDYCGWVAADGSYVDGSAYTARPAYETAPGAPPQLAIPSVKQNSSRPNSPPVELSTSPRFGPGPPIVTSERVKGPRGCNLFVFHLPNEITNWDLYLLFRRFGTILSVHTMVNKATGLSKGFGFVSFSAPHEATNAITEMDGFRLGKKRLKVQLKRSQDDNPDDEMDVKSDDNSASYHAYGYEAGGTNPSAAAAAAAATATTTTTAAAAGAAHNGPHGGGRGFEGRSRQNSFNSSYSYDNGGSGNTTRASTPYAHHHQQQYQQRHNPPSQHYKEGGGGGGSVGSDSGYYHGVDSTPHSPTALDDHKSDPSVVPQMANLSIGNTTTTTHRDSRSSQSSSGGGSSGNRSSGNSSSGSSSSSSTGRLPRV